MSTSPTIDPHRAKQLYGEHYAVDYDVRRFTTVEGSFAQQFEEELFIQTLKAHGAKNVLDAPVGTGRLAMPLARHFTITGADISPAMLVKAKMRADAEGIQTLKLIECSVDQLPFPDGHFDAVVTARLFQHVPKDMAHSIVCELSRVVTPGGIVLVQFRSGLFGIVLKFVRYYLIKRTGNIRHKCIFPDQVAKLFEGHRVVARFGYKFPVSGRLATILGYRTVAAMERVLANTPVIRWLGKYMMFVVQRQQ